MRRGNCSTAGVILLAAFALSACGGGGSSTPGDCTPSVATGFAGLINTGDGDGGAGGGGGIGEGGVGVGGSLGQFRGALVAVTDQRGALIGEAVTDDQRGLVTVKLCDYAVPITAEVRGRDGATYFDEATGQAEPFPPGKRLRVRVASVTNHIGVTPFTEAAVQLMEASGVSSADQITAANQRIGRVLSDQVPGIFRPPSPTGGFGEIDITRLPRILNEDNARTAGTLPDTPGGRYGAVNAGFSRAAGSFLVGDPTPALTGAEQLAADLADGKLDLQGLAGPVAGDRPPAYTYESLWRAKTVGSGLTTEEAGDETLKAKNAPVAQYYFSVSRTYQSCSFATGSCTPLVRRTDGSQLVELDSKGQLSIRRVLVATMGPQLRFITARHVVDLPGTFVEARIGTQGEVVALRQDRASFLYIDAMQLYEVKGDEPVDYDPAIEDFVDRNGVLMAAATTVDTQVVPVAAVGANLRVVTYENSPSARTFQDGEAGIAPAFVAVLTDGSLRGIRPSSASGSFAQRWGAPQWIQLPVPEPLQSVVYDKFVPPAHDAAYGSAPKSEPRLPFSGPRRLYGLTRKGEVKVWLEGRQASGRALAIPGKVVQLAAESKASVYALTADGQVFWVNADQAHQAAAGEMLTERPMAQYPRPFALNHVQPVIALADKPICWVANDIAVVCGTGEVLRWEEIGATLDATPDLSFSFCGATTGVSTTGRPLRDEAYVSGGLRPVLPAQTPPGLGPVWRVNSVAEFQLNRQGDFRQSCRIEGVRFLGVNGRTADQATTEGRRSIATDLVPLPDGRGGTALSAYITGRELRQGLSGALALFAQGSAALPSTSPAGYFASLQISSPQSGALSYLSVLSGPVDIGQTRPPVLLTGSYLPAPGGTSSLQIAQVTDQAEPRTVNLAGNSRTWNDEQRFRLGSETIAEWQFSPDPQAGCGEGCRDERGQLARWQVLLLASTDRADPYVYSLCFRIRIEKAATANIRFICTRHGQDGAALGFNLTDRTLRPDGLLELVDFQLF
jgi:hypothetical protein